MSIPCRFRRTERRWRAGSYDNSVKLWQVKSGKVIRSLNGHSSAWSIQWRFRRTERRWPAGSYDNSVKLWQVKSGKEIRSLNGHSSSVLSVAFSPDGETIASGSYDNSVKLWQVKSGKEIRSLNGHSSYVNSVAFSPDGETIASGSDDNSVKLWQVKSGELLATLIGNSGQRFERWVFAGWEVFGQRWRGRSFAILGPGNGADVPVPLPFRPRSLAGFVAGWPLRRQPGRHALSGLHGPGRPDVLPGGISGQRILLAQSRRRSAGQIHVVNSKHFFPRRHTKKTRRENQMSLFFFVNLRVA
jgi:hypothetical protein